MTVEEDREKRLMACEGTSEETLPLYDGTKGDGLFARFLRFSYKLDSYGIELRGIHRTTAYDRKSGDLRQMLTMALFWMSGCGGLSSMSGFFLGPLVFNLGFKDAVVAGTVGSFIGTGVCAYGSMMGPRSGLRQMVGARFQFGWWPAKILALLNVLTLLGWSVVNCVFGGGILTSLSDNKVPIEVGIVIISVVSLSIAIFGIRYVQFFESFAAIPVILTFMLLYVAAGKYFHIETESIGNSDTIKANWISHFSNCFGVTGTWIAISSDYYVEFPENFPKYKTILLTWISIFLPTIFVGILGTGIASGARVITAWNTAFEELGNGGLLAESYFVWGAGGKFLLVILYISLVSNNILNTYSIALSSQVWGLFFTKVPRYILAICAAVVYFVLAMVGRDKLSTILGNFLPMITYWCVIYFAVLIEENVLFRRNKIPGKNDVYDWDIWNSPKKMPTCYAACISSLIGIAGAVLGMCQVYYVGPLAQLLGDHGVDVGVFAAFSFTAVTYPFLRYVEIAYKKKHGKKL
ncbi:hypothetical protein TRICI_000844 [Trichomonascus ciferrii]|uniref:Purine-cytosine permease n=1 Tax=Trichomonascus ciferrii TaxID=44093 RepID=A0A642VCX7_9ASCO|nr:hypothetical protein TRICI_000844 [Trichomonascus ciferrii]